jgi:Ca2+-binding RTX toxin-like protein
MKRITTAALTISALFAGLFTATSATAAAPACTITISTSGTAQAQNSVSGTSNSDVICIRANYVTVLALAGNDTVIDYGDNNVIYLGDGSDNYNGTNGDDAVIDGGTSNEIDTIIGTPGDDEISGGGGDDNITGGAGNDNINGGDGADSLKGNAGADVIVGGPGNDGIDGGDGVDTIYGGDGDDSVIGGAADDSIYGGNGNDDLRGSAGRDEIFGEVGEDRIAGNDDAKEVDILAGGDGVDTLIGGFGLDFCDYTTSEVKTSTCIYDDKAPEVSNFRWNSFQYDSTLAAIPASATFDLTDDVESKLFQINCHNNSLNLVQIVLNWNGSAWVNSQPYNQSRIVSVAKISSSSSDKLSKSARITIETTIPKYTTPGSYTCTVLTHDNLEHRSVGQVTALTVTREPGDGTSSAYDDDAPALNSFTWDNFEYNVTNGDAEVNFDVELEDRSGIRQFQLNCYGSNRSPLTLYFFWNGTTWTNHGSSPATFETLSGNDSNLNPVLRITTSITRGTKPGVHPCYIWASDSIGQSGTNHLGTPLRVKRDLIDGGWDDDAPEVTSSSWNRDTYEIGGIHNVAEMTLSLTDRTGIREFGLNCYGSTGMMPVNIRVTKTANGWFVDPGTHDAQLVSSTGDARALNITLRTTIQFGTVPGPQSCGVTTWDTLGHMASRPAETLNLTRTPPGMPNEPSNLQYTPTEGRPNEGTLTWDAPTFLGEPVMLNGQPKMMPDGRTVGLLADYEIDYSVDGGDSWRRIDDGYSVTTNLPVSNLIAGTRYLFRVRGNNGGNDIAFSPGAPWSEVLDTRTPEPMTPDAPTNLEISGVTKTTAVMRWTAPEFNGGAPIRNFVVQTSLDGGSTWKNVTKAESTSVNLSLRGLAPGANYLVRVAGSNRAGADNWVEGSFQTPQGLATAPQNLVGWNNTGTNLLLTWDLPESNGGSDIINYQIEVSGNGGSSWTKIKRDSASAIRNFAVRNLTKGKDYRFRVSAITQLGVGLASEEYRVTTLVTPAGAPTNFRATKVTGKTATLTWSAPADRGGSTIYDYTVELSNDGGDTWIENVDITESASRSFNLSGLTPGMTYTVQISAVNDAGYSDMLTGTFTTKTLVPTVPLEFSGEMGLTTAELSWVTPESNGGADITDYKVEVSSNCKTYVAIAHEASNQTTFAVSSLQPGTKYCFKVSAKNSVGFSPAASVLTLVTDGNAPSAPTGLGVKPSATSVKLTWSQAPVLDGSPVRNYVVEFSKDGGATWNLVRKSVSTSKSLTVTGLKRGSTYQFRVASVNDVGTSDSSAALVIVTKAR